MSDAVALARQLADDLLFPDAMRVDVLDRLPSAHIDALAAAGLYGAIAPGGLKIIASMWWPFRAIKIN